MPGADVVRSGRERDKLTIAEVCADLGISRRTFYEWRAKAEHPGASRCRMEACASASPSISAGWPLTRKPPDEQDQL